MSCQPPSNWARRNAAAPPNNNNATTTTKHLRPVKATVPVSLMTQNIAKNSCYMEQGPTTSNNVNPAAAADPTSVKETNEEGNDDDEEDKEAAPVFVGPTRGEKARTLDMRTQPQEHILRRTASLDAIYCASPLKAETLYIGHFMIDKATQTPEEWSEEYQRTTSQWKPIVASGEQLEVKFIRQKLQRSNQNSKASGSGLLCCQRQSPVQADHSAISANNGSNLHNILAAPHKTQAVHTSGPIPIAHGPQYNVPGMPNSIEGLNQEIENLVLENKVLSSHEGEMSRLLEPPPEGHRAPIAELFHSVQNSSSVAAGRESRGSSGGTSSRSHSISPALPIIPGNLEFSISPFSDDVENAHKPGTSPHINYFLSREPPDGCEKVKIIDEPRCPFSFDLFPGHSSQKPEVTYVLLPSQSSAFCPLYKELERSASNPLFNSYAVISSTQTATNLHN